MTRRGQEQDKQRAQEAGFDRHLVKPVGFDRIVEIVDSLPPVREGGQPVT